MKNIRLPGQFSFLHVIAGLLIVSAVIEIAALITTPINGSDFTIHLFWLHSFPSLIREGVLLPRWLPDGFNGFGAPTFYFYPPFSYYLASIVSLISGVRDPIALFRITSILASVASVYTSYLFLRYEGAKKSYAFLGGLLYGFAPYRIFIAIHHSSFSAHISFIFIPLGFLFLERILHSEESIWKDFSGLAVSFALIMLSSMPNGIVFGVSSFLIVLFSVGERSWRTRVISLMALVAGVMLIGYYLIPILSFQSQIQPSSMGLQWEGESLPIYHPFFVQLLQKQNVTQNLMDLLVFISGIIVLICFWRQRDSVKQERPKFGRNAYIGIAFFILLAQIPRIHYIIGSIIPLYNSIQDWWRWNIVSCLLLALAWSTVKSDTFRRQLSLVVILWAFVAIPMMVTRMADVRLHREEPSIITDPPWVAPVFAPKGEADQHTQQKIIIAHASDPFLLTEPPEPNNITAVKRGPKQFSFATSFLLPTRLTLHQWYWPQWEERIDGKVSPCFHDTIGRAITLIPAGKHTVMFSLLTSRSERIGNWISLLTLSCLVGMILFARINRKAVHINRGNE